MATKQNLNPSGTPLILLDEQGRGWIEGTSMRVDQVVSAASGPDAYQPEDLLREYAHTGLTREGIEAAMGWYASHQAEIDEELERTRIMFEEGRAKQHASPEFQKLLAKWAERAASLGLATSQESSK